MEKDYVLEAVNISKIYNKGMSDETVALDNVNLNIEEKDFICIMGPSGSGKTTLINCLSTLDKPTSGKVYINGDNVLSMTSRVISEYRYQNLGYIFQSNNLIDSMNVYDNIAAPLILAKMDAQTIDEKVKEIAAKLNIEHLLTHNTEHCSGGEKQRISICRALITSPKLIVADEPTGNLDSKNSHELMSILKQLNEEGKTLLVVTHDPMIASYSKKLVYVHDGKIQTILDKGDKDQQTYFNEIINVNAGDYINMFFNKTK